MDNYQKPLNNFLGLEKKYSSFKDANFVILPIPYEESTTFQKGTKSAPKAIIEASKQVELYDLEEDIEPYLKGIHTSKPLKVAHRNPSKLMKDIESKVSNLVYNNKIPIILGGEHSISAGVLAAFVKKYKNNLSLLHLDAHADLRDSYLNSKYNHACALKRMRDKCKNTVSVGIRSLDLSEKKLIRKEKIIVFDDYYLKKMGLPLKKVNSHLTNHIYLSIDVDVLSPALIPDVGTPEPGGLEWPQITKLLKYIAKNKKIVGFDMVELKPHKGSITSNYIIAKLIYKIIGYIAKYNSS